MSTTLPALDLAAVRRDFPILDQEVNGRRMVYLDTAASSQKPRVVIDALADYYRTDNANVHRGLYDLSRRATERFEEARHVMAGFLNAPYADEVIWVRGTTEAINLVAACWGSANLTPGDEIILTQLEHHSNIVPWQLIAQRTGAVLKYVDIDDEGRLRLDHLDELLSPRTRLMACGHISNALGTINPIAEIAAKVHAAGALLLVDGAQGAPHLKIDVQALDCDFYAVSGHKMCGPMGIGVLWGRRELLDDMPPYQGGGEMIDQVHPEMSTWASVPHKFEAGTPDVGAAVALAVAARYLNGLGHEAMHAHEQELIRYGFEVLDGIPGLQLYGPRRPEERIAVFSFTLAGVHPHDIATILDAEGVAVRAGHHCTQPLMRRLGVPATARASAYIYNGTEDLDRLADGLMLAKSVFGS